MKVWVPPEPKIYLSPRTFYVDGSVKERIKMGLVSDGLSWNSAFPNIQDAMNGLNPGDTIYVSGLHVETMQVSEVNKKVGSNGKHSYYGCSFDAVPSIMLKD